MENHEEYIDNRRKVIEEIVDELKCQPILFVGSGLSIRYFDGPNWEELLEEMADRCPNVEHDIEYYFQGDKTLPEIGGILADAYYEWAWNEGREEFPEKFRTRNYEPDIFLKHHISKYLKKETPDSIDEIQSEQHRKEIELLQEIQPHAIITTNYDPLLEIIFPDYEPVVGEQILRSDYQSVGEILKIHGSVSDPSSIVLTDEDYVAWEEKKKYLSAKLLTFFAEHPVLITGYDVGDSNVKRILADIDEILSPEGNIIQNLFFLQWESDILEKNSFSQEHQTATIDGKSIQMNHIQAESFDWVFEAFGTGGNIEGVNLKLLRTLMANTYDIIKTKAPKKQIEINYESLSRAVNSGESFGTVFGVTTHDSPMDFNIVYRYRLSSVAEELGWDTWHYANQLIEQIEEEKGINIKESDNQYHMDIAFDREEPQHRYSDAAVELLQKVKQGEEYELDL